MNAQDYSQPQAISAQQMPVTSDEMYANIIQEERVKNIIAQISPEVQLYEIEMRIKGRRKNPTTNLWEKIDPNVKEVSGLLVSRYISYLSSILNQNTSLSNLSENQVNKIMKLVIEWLVDDIDTNAELYELNSDYTERTRIAHIMLNSTFMVLNRALNGQEARRMWGSLSLSENNNPFQNKKGAFDFLKAWK
jgi:hypothetical protein